MASQLNIKDRRTNEMVAELARLTGHSKTEVVREAVREKLTATKKERERRVGNLMAVIHELHKELKTLGPIEPYSDDDYYDEYGLPK